MRASKLPYYQQKTNPKASFWGDMCLIFIPVVQTGIANAPNLTETQTYWISFGVGLILIGVKFWLKSFKIETSE